MIQASLTRPMLLVVLLALASPSAAAAERPARNVLRPAVPVTLEPEHSPTNVILKFVDATPIRLVEEVRLVDHVVTTPFAVPIDDRRYGANP